MRNSPEKSIQKKCQSKLDTWQSRGIIIHYDDLSNAGRKFNPFTGCWIMNTKKGRPDIVAYLLHDKVCYVLFFEIKNPEGYKWSEEQVKFAEKFTHIQNVYYQVTTHQNLVDDLIEDITGYSLKLLNSIKEPG